MIEKINDELNERLRNTLEKYKKLESPFINLFSNENIYSMAPFFAFRFQNSQEDDFLKLEKILIDFVGLLKWTISRKPELSKNWLIEPTEIKEFRDKYNSTDSSFIKEKIGKRYFEICKMAIEDVDNLCNTIENELHL